MIQWNVIEILQKFEKIWGRLGKWLEVFIKLTSLSLDHSPLDAGLIIEKKDNTADPSLQGKVGFRYIMETNWKSTSRFSSFFLPHGVPLNLSFSLFRTKSLSFII